MNRSEIRFRGLLKGTKFEEGINKLITDSKNKVFGDLGKNGFEHSSKVEYYLDKLVPDEIKKRLNKFEIYVLLSAVYLHDIGYLKDGKLVSKGHPERTYFRILHEHSKFKEYGLDNINKASAVAEVCFGHGSEEERPLRKIDDRYRVEEWEGYLNLRFLSAILRLADELDNAYTRILGHEEEKKSMRSKISAVDIDTESWRIRFIINPLNSNEWKCLDTMREYTQSRLEEIIDIIEPMGILYHQIETNKPKNPYEAEQKRKSGVETLKKLFAILRL